MLTNSVQERHALLLNVLLHGGSVVQFGRFCEIQDSDQALGHFHGALELCHSWVARLSFFSRSIGSAWHLTALSPPGAALIQDSVLVVCAWILFSSIINNHVAENYIILKGGLFTANSNLRELHLLFILLFLTLVRSSCILTVNHGYSAV